MATLTTIIHIVVCFALIMIVLLQTGKGASMGAAFGGSSQTVFGSGGATTFLTKMTTIAAAVFMITSLLLAFMYGPGSKFFFGGWNPFRIYPEADNSNSTPGRISSNTNPGNADCSRESGQTHYQIGYFPVPKWWNLVDTPS